MVSTRGPHEGLLFQYSRSAFPAQAGPREDPPPRAPGPHRSSLTRSPSPLMSLAPDSPEPDGSGKDMPGARRSLALGGAVVTVLSRCWLDRAAIDPEPDHSLSERTEGGRLGNPAIRNRKARAATDPEPDSPEPEGTAAGIVRNRTSRGARGSRVEVAGDRGGALRTGYTVRSRPRGLRGSGAPMVAGGCSSSRRHPACWIRSSP